MNQIGPWPRYRLYTSINHYWGFLKEWISGSWRKGDEVTTLELAITKLFGVENAICVSRCRMGIHLTIKGLIKPGQEVIMSPYTIADVVNMVIAAGAKPVFVDIDRETCNISFAKAKAAVTPNTGLVLVTHLHGLRAPLKEFLNFFGEKSIPVLEDAAQAFGATFEGKKLGTLGHAGIYSLGAFKNINSWFGGVIVTNDQKLAEKIRAEIKSYQLQTPKFLLSKILPSFLKEVLTLPQVFRNFTFWIFRFGFLYDIEFINKRARTELDLGRYDRLPDNYKAQLSPLQARLALSQLKNIESHNLIRMESAEMYHLGLKSLPGLILPPLVPAGENIFTYYPVQYREREKLLKFLMRHHRDVAAQHLKNCADLESFKEFFSDCPNARATASQVILLPTYPSYPKSEVEKNIRVINKFFRET